MNTKQIKRDKQVEAAAISYACDNSVSWDYDSSTGQYNESDETELEDAFIAGAAFADDIPRPGLVDIEDVGDIYMTWLEEGECGDFVEYLKDECIKAGWI